jgi:hypothetical protein
LTSLFCIDKKDERGVIIELGRSPFSLLDMLRLYADKFVDLARVLEWATNTLEAGPHQLDDLLPAVRARLNQTLPLLEGLELEYSLKYATRILRQLRESRHEHQEVMHMLRTLHERIVDELEGSFCFRIPPDKAKYYDDKLPFGEEVASRFPPAVGDIEHAARCLAFGEGTACVFHLMRAMEFAVRELAGKLSLTNADVPWGSLLRDMRDALKLKKGIMPKDEYDAYSGVIALLENVKDAWRNPTMHPAAKYDDAEALDVYSAVRSFMVNLTTKL